MEYRKDLKRIAWITVPAFISTDRFIIPELSKYYNIDWYLITKKGETIDFIDSIANLAHEHNFSFKIIELSYRSSDPRLLGVYSSFIKSIKKLKYDLVYNVMIGIPYYMVLLRLLYGNERALIAIHNVHVPKGGTMYIPSKLYTWFTLKNFRYFQTFSRSQKEELLRLEPNKYCDNVNFVLMDYGAPTTVKPHDIITFLSFGYIREYKRIDVLIKAAEKTFELTKKKFKVIIAGSCENWDIYQELIKTPDLFDLRIRRIDDNEVPNLFGEADYFVATYQDIAQSGSAIIAVNYNMPIIASKLEAFENYVEEGKTGFLTDPASYEQLVEKMTYIVNNHECFYEKMRTNIELEKHNKFSASSVAKLYMKNFEVVVTGKK